jgi:hypothetical protein
VSKLPGLRFSSAVKRFPGVAISAEPMSLPGPFGAARSQTATNHRIAHGNWPLTSGDGSK